MDTKNELIDAFYNLYSSIAEINLLTKKAYFLKSDTETHRQEELSIEQLYHLIADDFAIDSEKSAIKYFLDINNLKSFIENKTNFSFDFQQKNGRQFKWKRVEFLCVPGNTDKLFLLFSNVDERHILDSILKNYVFNNNDFLYYVDLKNNSFLNFNKGKDNIILPPQSGNDYTRIMTEYNKKYVALEDQDRVMELMQPEYMLRRLKKEDNYKIEAGMIDENGSYRRKEVTIHRYDIENQLCFLSRRDITKEYLRQKNQKTSLETAYKMACTDILTNLYNRTGAQQEIEKRLSEIVNEIDAFIIIDLDNFKAVNDCLGHLQGDDLLQEIGKILKSSFRKTDIIARLGGDEFIIYMKDIKSKKNVAKAIKKLLNSLQLSYPWSKGNISVTASVGITLAPRNGMCFEDLYKRADKALYHAKRQGKNRFHFFSENETL